MALAARMGPDDLRFMERAFHLAEVALEECEVPVGCLFVYDGEEIGCGSNKVNVTGNPTEHAEMVALAMVKDWCVRNERLLNNVIHETTLYVTLEPCIMCASALYHLRLARIVYGAPNERFGGLVSVGDRRKYGAEHVIRLDGNTDVERAVGLLKRFYERENPFCPPEKRIQKKCTSDGVQKVTSIE